MKKIELKVLGMKCKGCEKRVCEVLEENLNVEKVIANHDKNQVIIKSEFDLDLDYVKELITNLGFVVED